MIMSFYIYMWGDILIISNNDQIIKFTKNMLNLKLYIKDMSLTYLILRIKIIRILLINYHELINPT